MLEVGGVDFYGVGDRYADGVALGERACQVGVVETGVWGVEGR
jgi:hypothetical protein